MSNRLLKLLQLLSFCLRKLLLDNVFTVFFYDYYDKIAAKGEGHKPDLDRQKFIAESELAILSILYKLIINLFFHRIAVKVTRKRN